MVLLARRFSILFVVQEMFLENCPSHFPSKTSWSVPEDVFSSFIILGHSKAVRDISFNNTGAQFLSAAYDRYVKLWDTETGWLCRELFMP